MEMKYIFEYRFVIAILSVILILTVARTVSGDHFRNGAERNAEPAFDDTNLITLDELGEEPGESLFLNLGMTVDNEFLNEVEAIDVRPGDITDRSLIRKIRRYGGQVVIVSDDLSVSASAWMILAQKGINDLYILEESNEWGSFKYQFNPVQEN
jgi:hypothetical protein